MKFAKVRKLHNLLKFYLLKRCQTIAHLPFVYLPFTIEVISAHSIFKLAHFQIQIKICTFALLNLSQMKKLIRENSYYYITCLFLFVCTSVLLLFLSKIEVTYWVNAHYSSLLDKIILVVDNMGTLPFAIIALAFLWIFKGRKIAFYGLICFISVSLFTIFLKFIVFPGTPRPTVLLEDMLPLRLIEGVIQRKTESFPSGHTSSAFAIATFFALVFPRKRWHVLFAVLAASVGYARIYLSQHFITDVYIGMLIGITLTTLIYYLLTDNVFTDKQKKHPVC